MATELYNEQGHAINAPREHDCFLLDCQRRAEFVPPQPAHEIAECKRPGGECAEDVETVAHGHDRMERVLGDEGMEYPNTQSGREEKARAYQDALDASDLPEHGQPLDPDWINSELDENLVPAFSIRLNDLAPGTDIVAEAAKMAKALQLTREDDPENPAVTFVDSAEDDGSATVVHGIN